MFMFFFVQNLAVSLLTHNLASFLYAAAYTSSCL